MTDTSTPTTAPAAPAAVATPTAPATAAEPKNESGGEVIFRTQEQFDRAFGERLGREKAKLQKDYDEKIEAVKTEATTTVTKAFESKLVKSATTSAATKLGFHDPADALAALDPEKLPIKDGEPDVEAIEKALKELVEKKPYLAKAEDGKSPREPRTKPKLPNGNPDPDKKGEGKLTAAEALRQLRAQGSR